MGAGENLFPHSLLVNFALPSMPVLPSRVSLNPSIKGNLVAQIFLGFFHRIFHRIFLSYVEVAAAFIIHCTLYKINTKINKYVSLSREKSKSP